MKDLTAPFSKYIWGFGGGFRCVSLRKGLNDQGFYNQSSLDNSLKIHFHRNLILLSDLASAADAF